jgi:hypothetical protein
LRGPGTEPERLSRVEGVRVPVAPSPRRWPAQVGLYLCGAHLRRRCFLNESWVSCLSRVGPPNSSAVEGVMGASVKVTPGPPACSWWLSRQGCPFIWCPREVPGSKQPQQEDTQEGGPTDLVTGVPTREPKLVEGTASLSSHLRPFQKDPGAKRREVDLFLAFILRHVPAETPSKTPYCLSEFLAPGLS